MATLSPSNDYETALAFLYGRINYERTPASSRRSRSLNLDRMRILLERLGNPHNGLPAVHVAGTKGKGSTATMISSVLTAAGYRTGLYTSPHLERLEERIMIDGHPVTPAELYDLVESMRPAVADLDRSEPLDSESRPTFFEITTAMAFRHFAQSKLDIAVLEVGMGGRLDSTNVCEPEVSVITTISFDHTRQLGNTLAAIAGEKAGIIKRGIPVVSGVITAEPETVIAETAAERGSPLFQLGRDFSYEYHSPEGLHPYAAGTFDYREPRPADAPHYREMQLGLLGAHQAANASVSLAALERLRSRGWRVPEEAMRSGIAHARCPARIEVLQREPTVVVDTAHNVASIEALLQTIEESFPQKQRLLVFSASRDKDWQRMLERLVPQFQHVVLTQYINNPRSVPPGVLEDFVRQLIDRQTRDGKKTTAGVVACSCPDEAWREVHRTTTPDHFICITGSFFLAAEMRSLAGCPNRPA